MISQSSLACMHTCSNGVWKVTRGRGRRVTTVLASDSWACLDFGLQSHLASLRAMDKATVRQARHRQLFKSSVCFYSWLREPMLGTDAWVTRRGAQIHCHLLRRQVAPKNRCVCQCVWTVSTGLFTHPRVPAWGFCLLFQVFPKVTEKGSYSARAHVISM